MTRLKVFLIVGTVIISGFVLNTRLQETKVKADSSRSVEECFALLSVKDANKFKIFHDLPYILVRGVTRAPTSAPSQDLVVSSVSAPFEDGSNLLTYGKDYLIKLLLDMKLQSVADQIRDLTPIGCHKINLDPVVAP